jgi:hypothetical protein
MVAQPGERRGDFWELWDDFVKASTDEINTHCPRHTLRTKHSVGHNRIVQRVFFDIATKKFASPAGVVPLERLPFGIQGRLSVMNLQ